MLKKSSLIKSGVRKIKSAKKVSVNVVKKTKSALVKKKIKPEKTPKTSITHETEEEFNDEIKELESRFNISAGTVEKAVEGAITLTVEHPKLKNELFNEQFPLNLQVNSIKVPNIHSKIVRLPLEHSIFTPDSEICLIVPDVKGIPNKEHDEHVEHYEKLLRKKDVTCVKKIMTFHEFRTEYEAFELKRRLVDLYDVFLVDGKISGKTVKKCGKIFYTKRKVPTAIKLQASKLKEHINQTLKKTPLYLHGNGDSFMIQIGHNAMEKKHIVENVFSVLKELDKQFPGGFNNIRSLNLTTVRGITVPIYVTLKNQSQVVLPKKAKKQTVSETVSGELTTRTTSTVCVKPTGEVQVFDSRRRGYRKNQEKPSPQKRRQNRSKNFKENKKTNKNKRKMENVTEDTNHSIKKKRKENNSQVDVKKSPKKNVARKKSKKSKFV